jgi:hypothetical protein
MNKKWLVVFWLVLCAASPIAHAADITLLPSQRIVQPFSANATEHRMSLTKVFDENMYIGSLGGVFPLADVAMEGYKAQFSLAGTFYTNLSAAAHQYIVTNGDYYVDAIVDISVPSALTLRLGMGHTSQHLMDDAIESEGLPHSLNYVRDYVQLFAIKDIRAIGGFLYAGAFYNYAFIINTHRDGTMIYEAGGEALNYAFSPMLHAYLAADVKLRGESAFGTTQNYQLGLKLSPGWAGSGSEGTRALRVALNYQAGLEERGQFYQRRVHRVSIGAYFDL